MDVKSVFAKNFNYYMALNGKTRKDLSTALGISYYTVSDWAQGKKYPRMDKVDRIATYLGVTKADLVEEKITEEIDLKHDFGVEVLVRLRSDEVFYSYVEDIMKLEPDKIKVLKQTLDNLKVFAK